MYVKFPKSRWKEIERAEKNDKEGDEIYENLKLEYLETYMPKPDANPHSTINLPENENFEDVENPYFGTKRDTDKRSISDEMK